jgi:peptidoglycan/xylan/chitin deacetylase (PgdA/CDA1 family)
MPIHAFTAIVLGALLSLSAAAHPAPSHAAPTRTIAITLDDLPVVSYGAEGHAPRELAIVQGWCRQLQAAGAPATGFFNLKRSAPALVQAWKTCGIQFGNHTLSHPHADRIALEDYLADLTAGHRAVQALLPEGTTIPFRYPYLRRGFDPKTRDAIRAQLAALESPVAPITIETMDWWYAQRWFNAKRDNQPALAARYQQAWRWNLEEATLIAEALSREVLGREAPQILLLHANEIGSQHITGYLQWLKRRGYTFISLDDALRDPAYARPITHTSPTGDSQWLRLRREAPR